MSEGTKHEAGTPSWADLGTTDSEAAVAFYAGLFGWEAENTPAGPAGTYVMCRLGGKDVVGLYEQDEAMRSRGVPPLWLVYISVDDVAAAAKAVEEAGGTVHAQPFDVAEAGRMALVQDPTGAMFGLWQAGNRAGAEVLHQPGAMDWFELATNDPEKAGTFYEQVLGWTVNAEEFDGTPYTTCLRGEEPVAGILPAEALPEGVAPNWSLYFAVEDCAATVEKAQQTGGELLFGPHEMPRVGQFAGLRDPQGAAFAVIQPTSTDDGSEDQSEGDRSEGEGSEGEGSKGEGSEDERSEAEESESERSEGEGSEGEQSEGEGSKGEDSQAHPVEGAQSGGSDDGGNDTSHDTGSGEANEQVAEEKNDRGEAQADGQEDDSGIR
jgi:predicted enzyme related to lactoylglutathione lyase